MIENKTVNIIELTQEFQKLLKLYQLPEIGIVSFYYNKIIEMIEADTPVSGILFLGRLLEVIDSLEHYTGENHKEISKLLYDFLNIFISKLKNLGLDVEKSIELENIYNAKNSTNAIPN